MTDSDRNLVNLDDLFAAARQDERYEASSDLMARVLKDAETQQAHLAEVSSQPQNQPGKWAQFVAVIGGWPSLTGLAAATVASVWVGFAVSGSLLPQGVSDLLSQNTDGYLVYLDDQDLYEFEEM